MGLLRLLLLGFVGLSVVYIAVSIFVRSLRREALEKEWDRDHSEEEDENARESFVDQGMADFNKGLRPRLLLLIYVIPAVFIVGVLILTNTN